MLRALFILLAVVSFVLAIVLDMPVLYIAAGGLVLISAAMLIASAKKRHDKSKKSYLSTTPGREHDEELAALGIADIRPRDRSRAAKQEDDDLQVMEESTEDVIVREPSAARSSDGQADADGVEHGIAGDGVPAGGSEGSGTDAELRALGIMEIRPRSRRASSPLLEMEEQASATPVARPEGTERRPAEDPSSPAAVAARERVRKEILTPYLQSLLSAIGANTVCLLRHDADPLKYHIEAIVSKNAYARSQGHFRSRVPLLTPAIARRPVLTFRIGEKGLPGSNLGYYLEPIAVKQIAVTDVPRSAAPGSFFLLADTMEDGALASPRQHALLSQFARLLGTVLAGGDATEMADDAADVRPRRDIIDEEIQRARSEKKPLALILVYLNSAEAISSEGEEAVNEAEAILEGSLREAVEGRRVEHFGELVYGVFDSGESSAVEPWVVDLQERLRTESGPLAEGVSIGIAMLKDRHTSAEAFRADAHEALREAYETGACTILE